MRIILNRYVTCLVLVAFVAYVVPGPALGKGSFAGGKTTAEEAASWQTQPGDKTVEIATLSMANPLGGGYAQPDTTEFDFPEEESKHLYRDITIFLIVSAFVGYFIVKVFLQGDTEEEPEETGGKKIPGT